MATMMEMTTPSNVTESTASDNNEFSVFGLPFELSILVLACIGVSALILLGFICGCCCRRICADKRESTKHLNKTHNASKKNSYLNVAVPVESAAPVAAKSTGQRPAADVHNVLMTRLQSVMQRHLDNFCIESEKLTLGDPIGSGRFGVVYKATLRDSTLKSPTVVAAKTVQGSECSEKEVNDFLDEVLRMRGFHHRNVLSMLGLVLQGGKPFAVLPFMSNGDLRQYLKDSTKKLVVRDLVDFCHQIAEGMTYLSEQKFVHRDLATRNCMVDDDLAIKIADFGLSRDIFSADYYRLESTDLPLPVRWMAAESIRDKVFTVKSDVWSFGVVMWEVMTRGMTPYMEKENPDVLRFVKQGGRLEQPQYCPDDVFRLMSQCWHELPEDRPQFRLLADELRQLLGAPRNKVQKTIDKYYNVTEVEAFQTGKKSPKKGAKSSPAKGAKASKGGGKNK